MRVSVCIATHLTPLYIVAGNLSLMRGRLWFLCSSVWIILFYVVASTTISHATIIELHVS